MTELCSHNSTVISAENELVCTDCALVVESAAFYTSFPLSFTPTFCDVDLEELGEKWHFSKRIIVETKMKYSQLKKALPDEKETNLGAYALYVTLIKHECVRLPEEVCYVFGIQKKELFHIGEKVDDVDIDEDSELKGLIARFCSILEFTFKEKCLVQEIGAEVHIEPCIQSKTLAVLLICYVSELFHITLSLKEITDKCGVSLYNIKRLMKVYPEIRQECYNVLKKHTYAIKTERD